MKQRYRGFNICGDAVPVLETLIGNRTVNRDRKCRKSDNWGFRNGLGQLLSEVYDETKGAKALMGRPLPTISRISC